MESNVKEAALGNKDAAFASAEALAKAGLGDVPGGITWGPGIFGSVVPTCVCPPEWSAGDYGKAFDVARAYTDKVLAETLPDRLALSEPLPPSNFLESIELSEPLPPEPEDELGSGGGRDIIGEGMTRAEIFQEGYESGQRQREANMLYAQIAQYKNEIFDEKFFNASSESKKLAQNRAIEAHNALYNNAVKESEDAARAYATFSSREERDAFLSGFKAGNTAPLSESVALGSFTSRLPGRMLEDVEKGSPIGPFNPYGYENKDFPGFKSGIPDPLQERLGPPAGISPYHEASLRTEDALIGSSGEDTLNDAREAFSAFESASNAYEQASVRDSGSDETAQAQEELIIALNKIGSTLENLGYTTTVESKSNEDVPAVGFKSFVDSVRSFLNLPPSGVSPGIQGTSETRRIFNVTPQKSEVVPPPVQDAPPAIQFEGVITKSGDAAILKWTAVNSAWCIGENFETGGVTKGEARVKPSEPTVYTITCAGKKGVSTMKSFVRIIPPPKVETTAPAVITSAKIFASSDFTGRKTTLTWESGNTVSCVGANFDTGGKTTGSVSVTQEKTTEYKITCANKDGATVTAATTVEVLQETEIPKNPTISVRKIGGDAVISWVAPTDVCTITGSDGFTFTTSVKSGSINAGPVKSGTGYTITCQLKR